MSEKSDHDLLVEIHQVMKDPDNGVCRQVKKLNDAVFNEGWGIAAQTRIMWGVFGILGLVVGKILFK
jgi:hypothetical protein